jgi:SnoaL-like domain
VRATFLIFAVVMTVAASAQPVGRVVKPAADEKSRIEQLQRAVDRAQSLRDVKQLQYLYSQLAQFGLWNEMANLFSAQGEIMVDDKVTFKGQQAIAAHLAQEFNDGKQGLPKGGLHADFIEQPVVTLSYDGLAATGRWRKLAMDGQQTGDARWSGGMQVNDYVKEQGRWRIVRLHYYPQIEGPYDTGFVSTKPNFPLVPYHYTPAQAGRPVPDEPSGSDRHFESQSLDQIEHRIGAMNDEDKIRNLQNMYGYYADRKMWSDVVDLFALNGVYEIGGLGVWHGPKSIRRALERDGPEGLQRGQVNDQLQLSVIVHIDPSEMEAHARGMTLGMLSPKLGEAYWAVGVFENRYIKQAGVWRVQEMHWFPQMKADYYQGWARSSVPEAKPAHASAPDQPSPVQRSLQRSGAIPAFSFDNPATGKAITYPDGAVVLRADGATVGVVSASASGPDGDVNERLLVAQRHLDVSKAYDAIENVSNTFGYYLDDNVWDQFTENIAVNGSRPQSTGFYVGREHIYRAMTQAHVYGGAPSPLNPRAILNFHQRLQPVILVAPSGRTAIIRTRLLLSHALADFSAGFSSGMYPNDSAVLEEGIWKLQMGGEIDETYFNSTNYKDGWARPSTTPGPASRKAATGISNEIDFPPDIPWSLFMDFRLKGMRENNWPDIKPMWFSYRNPVSGRIPPNYCPDFLQCFGQ